MTKRENVSTGTTGERIGGPPVVNESDHFYVCDACKQAVDMRDLGQVFHHEEPGHEPLEADA